MVSADYESPCINLRTDQIFSVFIQASSCILPISVFAACYMNYRIDIIASLLTGVCGYDFTSR